METRIWRFFAAIGLMIPLIACARQASPDPQIQDLSESAAFDSILSRLVGEDDRIGYDPSRGSIDPFVARRIALDENDSITVVYLVGSDWCGSGGCTLAVVHGEGRDARLAGWATIARPPIQVLPTSANGLPDISVSVRSLDPAGPPEYAILSFDGATYPLNPGLPPAVVVSEMPQGREIISGADVADAVARRAG